MGIHVFDYYSYRKFITDKISSFPANGSGLRKKLADDLGVSKSFISSVINSKSDISLSHSMKICKFFNFSMHEKRYFINLVQYEQSTDKDVKKHFFSIIHDVKAHSCWALNIDSEHVQLSDKVEEVYISNWYVAAIHSMLKIPIFQEVENIYRVMSLSKKKIDFALHFLLQNELIENRFGKYCPTINRVQLNDDAAPKYSGIIRNYVTSTLLNSDLQESGNIHNSIVVSLSADEEWKLSQVLSDAVSKASELARASEREGTTPEVVRGVVIDYFTPYDDFDDKYLGYINS